MSEGPGKKPSSEKMQKRELFRFLGVASTVGINLVICTFVGFAIGYWLLDGFLDTFPWFTIIFLILGIAAGFKYLLRVASRAGGDRNGELK
jgi:ATP synthase protein I